MAAPATISVSCTGGGARQAAESTARRNAVTVHLPGVHLQLPSADQLAFLAGVTALAAFEIIEWPVAVVLGVGHALASNRHRQAVRDFGAALEEA